MIRVHVMGRMAVEGTVVVDEGALPGTLGRTLLGALALHRGPVARRRLAEIVWATPPDAVDRSLNPLLSRVRAALVAAGAPRDLLVSTSGSVELRRTSELWIDVEEATRALDQAEGAMRRQDPSIAWPRVAVASAILVRPFLEGVDGRWVEQQRLVLQEDLVRAFEVLVDVWLALRDPPQAVTAARRLVRIDPLRESSHARLIRTHLAAGNRASALLAFHECARLTRDELGVEPSPMVQQAYRQALEQDG